tara:strand:- start:255 stop:371 length:117 start_codon:yes stop_codon:yes gene_type:complete
MNNYDFTVGDCTYKIIISAESPEKAQEIFNEIFNIIKI